MLFNRDITKFYSKKYEWHDAFLQNLLTSLAIKIDVICLVTAIGCKKNRGTPHNNSTCFAPFFEN
jgi:hypothetical protein